jgi:GNAT superfamily N-acetyltransferase
MAFAFSEWSKFADTWKYRATDSCIAARYRGALVGFNLVGTDSTVKYIAVHPEYQGYKIGSGLLTRLLATLGDARSIHLTTAGDERLLTWYGRFGFRPSSLLYSDSGAFLGAHMTRRQRCRSSCA